MNQIHEYIMKYSNNELNIQIYLLDKTKYSYSNANNTFEYSYKTASRLVSFFKLLAAGILFCFFDL